MITCATIATIAATIHVNEHYTNSVHPGVFFECNDAKVGAYYNSVSDISAFAAYDFEFKNNSSLEIGMVTGYPNSPLPMLKYNYKNFFVMPTGKGAVLGIQLDIGD